MSSRCSPSTSAAWARAGRTSTTTWSAATATRRRHTNSGPLSRRQEARGRGAVPDALVDEVALCGPKERIAEMLEPWKQSRATTLILGAIQPEALQVMAELCL